ncbi:M16 family metallopeptidase [Campylobacter geochelonis]|uniref:M16 family metallopeptidase n=1 Tax=Campylobacter geochelonis TaxID=1780362 RepID=UPI00077073FC|nr:pitrilysin family protein [Campylobacter geochelonis]CZE51282.1 processing protease [Campylobacter geochelonis]
MKKIDLNIKNNQIPLLYKFDASLPAAEFKMVFTTSGGVIETKAGLANICAKMLDEGTKNLGVSEFSRLLEIRAIDIYPTSGFETFGVQINCLKEQFSYAFSMLIELFKEPNFTNQTLEKVKTQVKGEIATNQSEFDYLAKLELNKILYPNSIKQNPKIGTLESVDSINLDDVKEFIQTKLNLANLYLVLAGDVAVESVEFSKLLELFEVGEKRDLPYFKTSDKRVISEIKKDSQQAYIYFGAPYDVVKSELHKAKVATFILGSSGFGSRLMEEIRVKRGLAYSAYAVNSFALSSNRIWGYLQTKNESKEGAIEVVKSEFERFVKDGVSEDELVQAKNFLLGSVVLQKETMFKRVAIRENEFYNGFEFGEFERQLELIKELSFDELNSYIKAHDEILNLSFALICR